MRLSDQFGDYRLDYERWRRNRKVYELMANSRPSGERHWHAEIQREMMINAFKPIEHPMQQHKRFNSGWDTSRIR